MCWSQSYFSCHMNAFSWGCQHTSVSVEPRVRGTWTHPPTEPVMMDSPFSAFPIPCSKVAGSQWTQPFLNVSDVEMFPMIRRSKANLGYQQFVYLGNALLTPTFLVKNNFQKVDPVVLYCASLLHAQGVPGSGWLRQAARCSQGPGTQGSLWENRFSWTGFHSTVSPKEKLRYMCGVSTGCLSHLGCCDKIPQSGRGWGVA